MQSRCSISASFPRGIRTAAETAFHVIPILIFPVAGFQLRAQRVGRPRHSVSPAAAGQSMARIIGADHFGREQLGQQRYPSLPEMEGERVFAWAVPSKRRYFRKAVRTAALSVPHRSRMVTARSSAVFVLSVVSAQSQAADLLFPVRGTESTHHKMIIDMLVPCGGAAPAVWIISSGIDAICEKPITKSFCAVCATSE